MQPIVFAQIQDLLIFTIVVFSIGLVAGGMVVYKIAHSIACASEEKHRKHG